MLSTFWEFILWKWKAAEKFNQRSVPREQSPVEPVSGAPADTGRGLGALRIILVGVSAAIGSELMKWLMG